MKRIELFTFVYNDEDLLPFFLDHYGSMVDKMTFIDSGSTDATLQLIKDHEVVQTGLTWWDWGALHKIRQTIWKSSKYDLVMFPDLDEFFYRKNLRNFLEITSFDIYQMEGFQMVSKYFPAKGSSIFNIKKGVPLPLHNKYMIFNPRLPDLELPDAHFISCSSTNISRLEIKLLHYKYLGVDNMMRRTKLVKSRVPADSYCEIIGGNVLEKFPSYIKTRQQYEQEINELLRIAKDVI